YPAGSPLALFLSSFSVPTAKSDSFALAAADDSARFARNRRRFRVAGWAAAWWEADEGGGG
ncbi:hypothetical protein ScalyP_jg1413, partial [Parmales sp. scaly parma]